jgi:hypothetical protein
VEPEQKTPDGQEEQYSGPVEKYDFEVWLAEQTDREDETGAIARFVIADLEKGCWPTTGYIDARYAWWGTEKAQERQLMAFSSHMAHPHNQGTKAMLALERAFKEFVAAEDEARKRFMDWMAEQGESPFQMFYFD